MFVLGIVLFFFVSVGEATSLSKRNACGTKLTGTAGTLTSPNYPQNYPNDANCQWVIQGPPGTQRIDIVFEYMNIEWGAKCEWDSVVVKEKGGKQVGKKLCGRLDKQTVTVPGDLAIVVLTSDNAVNEKGFEARYVAAAPPKPVQAGSCSFDKGLCPGFSNVNNNVDDFDWTVHSGATPTPLTGPKTDHSGKGQYVYIESTGRVKGDKAQLQTQELTGNRCLAFFYHMYGIVGMGGLKVYIVTSRQRRLVMSLSGNQGDQWKKAQVQIKEIAPYKVEFEGIVGKSDYSDIAIDDITISKTPCSRTLGCRNVLTASSGTFTSPGYPHNYPDNLRCEWVIRPSATTAAIVIRFKSFRLEMEPQCRDDYVTVSDSNGQPVKKARFCGFYVNGFGLKVRGNEARVYFHSNGHLADKGFQATYETIPTTSSGDCDFDNGICLAWSNAVNDDFDWSIGKDKTHSFFTGPRYGDVYVLGNYAYIEASGRRHGDKAILVSGSITGSQCLTFSYNMNGQQMGSLIVSVKNSQGSRMAWKVAGDHGKFWLKESVNVDGGQSYQVTFEGVVGDSFTSDIAIDDIYFTSGRCAPKTGCSRILTGATGSFHSPNFPSPYPTGVDCTWTIIPPPHFEDVTVTFYHVDIEQSAQCSKDYIAVEDITGTPKGPKMCGSINANKTVEVDWHQTKIHFHSDDSTVGKGFEASYQAFGPLPVCGGQLSGNSGKFYSPNYPSNYPNRVTCDWEITVPQAKEIKIKFEDFAIDDSPVTCSYDYLLVLDAQHNREVGRFCGMYKPLPISIKGNVVNIRFQSSHLHVARGFKAIYTAL